MLGGLPDPMISKAIPASSAMPDRLGQKTQWTGPKEEVGQRTDMLVGRLNRGPEGLRPLNPLSSPRILASPPGLRGWCPE
ncbi:unnamed protein product [Danaus chrysippus]|uniref:(African queen) hypothetical protein n=1 Tax=Danaus chrysippus TaxID=151541 RepID=A0A8J2QK64_9NEOP|nr:unnamed protein product [Danaus chrysippus]